jgi:hypothetical protein
MKMTHGISSEKDKEICEDTVGGGRKRMKRRRKRRRKRKRISYYYTSYKSRKQKL